MNDKIITLVSEKNLIDTFEGELLCAFEMNGNKYVVYDKNEKDYDDNLIVYFGKIIDLDDKQHIVNLDSMEYELVKDIVKKMIDYSGDEENV